MFQHLIVKVQGDAGFAGRGQGCTTLGFGKVILLFHSLVSLSVSLIKRALNGEQHLAFACPPLLTFPAVGSLHFNPALRNAAICRFIIAGSLIGIRCL